MPSMLQQETIKPIRCAMYVEKEYEPQHSIDDDKLIDLDAVISGSNQARMIRMKFMDYIVEMDAWNAVGNRRNLSK